MDYPQWRYVSQYPAVPRSCRRLWLTIASSSLLACVLRSGLQAGWVFPEQSAGGRALGAAGRGARAYRCWAAPAVSHAQVSAPEKRPITYVKALRLNQAHRVQRYYSSPEALPPVLDNLTIDILPTNKRNDLLPV